MRILLLTQLFHPEPNLLKGLTFARELVKRGHTVEVLTCYPNYPGGKIYDGFKQRLFQREEIDGVTIYRLPLYPSHDASSLKRILCYASFALSALGIGSWLVKRADIVHVYQGPATLALPAMVWNALWRVPYVYDIQDIWPDSLTSSGMMHNTRVLNMVNRWCNAAYRFARRIIVLSDGFKALLVERGVPAEKIDVVYNWCEETDLLHSAPTPEEKAQLGFGDRFVVMFAGSMGTVQALDAVVQAAPLLRERAPQVQLVFVGGGVEVDRLKALAAELQADNVTFVPRQPSNVISRYLAAADVLLIHLKDQPLFRITIPQKTQAYMAAGRPIIIALEGEATEIVTRAGAGIACTPEDVESIANAIISMYNLPVQEREQMGQRGRAYYLRELSMHVGISKMDALFQRAVQKRPRAPQASPPGNG